jgi:hypothetical protein
MKDGYTRLQFDFSEDAIERINRLESLTESTTKAEVVRKSLKFYEYAVNMLNEGYVLELKKENEKINIVSAII